MPNSNIYEKGNVLPGGGGLNPILRQDLKLQNPMQPQPQNLMQPQLQTQSPLGLQPVAQQMTQQITPTLKQNYFASKPIMPQTTAQTQKTIPTAPLSQGYTPSPANPTQSVFDYLLAPSEEEKKLSKNNESKKRLLLLSDALRHLGNIYNTTRGATPQQFNSPVMEQEQLYQRKRNELRAQRTAALKNAMAQAKLQADQDYKNSMLGMRAAELDRQRANDDWNRQWNQFKWAGDQANKDREFDFKKANADRTFAETARHNRVGEGLRAQANRIAQQNANTSSSRTSKSNLNDYQPIKIAQGNTGYISKKWMNSPEGRAEIKAMYNRMRQMKQRLPDGRTKELISEAKVKKDSYGVPVAAEPSTMDMLVAMQEGAWSQPYMDWIDKYALDPTGVNWTPKHPTYYKKFPKGKVTASQVSKPQAKPKATPKTQQQKPKSVGDKYSKYERN